MTEKKRVVVRQFYSADYLENEIDRALAAEGSDAMDILAIHRLVKVPARILHGGEVLEESGSWLMIFKATKKTGH